jgi:Protein ENHANCED DISEASE RESISTANCE 2, C-terminal
MALSSIESEKYQPSQQQQQQLNDKVMVSVPAAVPSSGSSEAVPSSGSSEAGSEEEFNIISLVDSTDVAQQRSSSPVFDMLIRTGIGGDEYEILEGRVTRQLCINDCTTNTNTKFPSPLPMGTLLRSSTVPTNQLYMTMMSHPPSLRLDAWSETFAHNFMVRGGNYLLDNKKVTSESSLFQLLTVDLIYSDTPNFHGLCGHPNERIQLALQKEKDTGIKQVPSFVFAVNLCVPAPASSTGSTTTNSGKTSGKVKSTSCYHLVVYFGIDDLSIIRNHSNAIGRLCNEFFFGTSDKFRDMTFKLIPRITEGNFVVRKAVGSKPSILGKKLKQYYIRTDRYMELIVDIGSDSVATRIVKLALGYAKTLTVDMMFVLEGATSDTLPERILGGVRVKEIDFKNKDGQRVFKGI